MCCVTVARHNPHGVMILLFYWLVGKLYAWEELGPPSSMKLLHETRANASCSLQGFGGLSAGEPDRCPALKLHPRAQLRPAAAAIFGVKENVRRSPRRAERKAGSGPLCSWRPRPFSAPNEKISANSGITAMIAGAPVVSSV